MTKDVAIKSDLDVQVKSYVNTIEVFRSSLHDWGADHLSDVRKYQVQLEALDKAAGQSRLSDIQKEVAMAKVEIAQWFGSKLKSKELTIKDVGFDRKTVQRYTQLADTPKTVYEYAIQSTIIPSINRVLTERTRYLALKALVKEAGEKQAESKRMFAEGYSIFQAERELKGDDVDVDLGVDLEDDDPEMEISFDMSNFDESVQAIEARVEELTDVLKEDVEITTEVYKLGVGILRRLRASTKRLSELFMEIKKEIV